MMLLPILLAVPALAPAPVAAFFLAELVAMRRAVMAAWWAMGVGTMLLFLLLLLFLPEAKRPLPPLLPAVVITLDLDDERPAFWSLGMPPALALAVLAAACAAAPRWWPATGIGIGIVIFVVVIDPVSATVVGDGRGVVVLLLFLAF